MLNHKGLSLSVGFIAGIQIIGNLVGLSHHFRELIVDGNQLRRIRLSQVVDVGIVCGIVGVVIAIGLLEQVVLRIAVVSAPAIDIDGGQLRSTDFLCQRGDIGADVQDYVVLAEIVFKDLFQNDGSIQLALVVGRDIIVNGDGEGNALRSQLGHCLLLILGAQIRIEFHGSFAVGLAQAQVLNDQICVVRAIRGIAQAGHGVGVVLTLHGVDGVIAPIIIRHVQRIVPA